MCALQDIGIFKLLSVSNRTANKDVYDLDFINNFFKITYGFKIF